MATATMEERTTDASIDKPKPLMLIMADLGVTYDQLHSAANVSTSVLYDIMHGSDRIVRYETREHIAAALGLKVDAVQEFVDMANREAQRALDRYQAAQVKAREKRQMKASQN